jgi:hypothetical protein
MERLEMAVTATLNPNLFIRHGARLTMFEPEEESVVLEIISSLLDIAPDEMVRIGEATKKLITFDPSLESEEEATARLKVALDEMSKEEAVMAGVFTSGLLRCNLAEQYMRAMGGQEGCGEPE